MAAAEAARVLAGRLGCSQRCSRSLKMTM
jgi:hypothetical protein